MIRSLRLWHYLTRYVDGLLLSGILLLMLTGLLTLYSATDANPNRVTNQATNMLVALGIMWLVANIPLQHIMRIALPIYMTGSLAAGGRCAVRRDKQWRAALAEYWRNAHPAFGTDENSGTADDGVVFRQA